MDKNILQQMVDGLFEYADGNESEFLYSIDDEIDAIVLLVYKKLGKEFPKGNAAGMAELARFYIDMAARCADGIVGPDRTDSIDALRKISRRLILGGKDIAIRHKLNDNRPDYWH